MDYSGIDIKPYFVYISGSKGALCKCEKICEMMKEKKTFFLLTSEKISNFIKEKKEKKNIS